MYSVPFSPTGKLLALYTISITVLVLQKHTKETTVTHEHSLTVTRTPFIRYFRKRGEWKRVKRWVFCAFQKDVDRSVAQAVNIIIKFLSIVRFS